MALISLAILPYYVITSLATPILPDNSLSLVRFKKRLSFKRELHKYTWGSIYVRSPLREHCQPTRAAAGDVSVEMQECKEGFAFTLTVGLGRTHNLNNLNDDNRMHHFSFRCPFTNPLISNSILLSVLPILHATHSLIPVPVYKNSRACQSIPSVFNTSRILHLAARVHRSFFVSRPCPYYSIPFPVKLLFKTKPEEGRPISTIISDSHRWKKCLIEGRAFIPP